MRFRIFLNETYGRVLVSGKDSDLQLVNEGWKIVKEFEVLKDAYSYAREIADRFDYILEWYIDEVKN